MLERVEQIQVKDQRYDAMKNRFIEIDMVPFLAERSDGQKGFENLLSARGTYTDPIKHAQAAYSKELHQQVSLITLLFRIIGARKNS